MSYSLLQMVQLVGLVCLDHDYFIYCIVALNFGLYRQSTFNSTPFYVMFYDMGATSTTATIAGKLYVWNSHLTPLSLSPSPSLSLSLLRI